MQEMNTYLKTAESVKKVLDKLMQMFSNCFDVLLKNRDKLTEKELERINNMKKINDAFKEHVANGGLLVPFSVTKRDKELIEQVCEDNDKAFIKAQNGDDVDFERNFAGKHFAFDFNYMEISDDSYLIFLKDIDLEKLAHLKNYLDENNYHNNISTENKDIRNLLKIDENQVLMCFDVPKRESYEIIANMLNANKIPFEVANAEHETRIIYELQYMNEVKHLIDNCKNIDVSEKSYYILSQKKFNDRQESKKEVEKMLNSAPSMDEILKSFNNGRE